MIIRIGHTRRAERNDDNIITYFGNEYDSTKPATQAFLASLLENSKVDTVWVRRGNGVAYYLKGKEPNADI